VGGGRYWQNQPGIVIAPLLLPRKTSEFKNDEVYAIRILISRPRDWITKALSELQQTVTQQRFTRGHLRKAHKLHYHKAPATS
jgi:hypothetical protein